MIQRHVQIHVLMSGQVQGVGFRFSTQRQATAWGLRGWVRNLADGSAEAVFQGPEPTVDAMVAWCRRGPLHASVVDVAVTEAVGRGVRGVRRAALTRRHSGGLVLR